MKDKLRLKYRALTTLSQYILFLDIKALFLPQGATIIEINNIYRELLAETNSNLEPIKYSREMANSLAELNSELRRNGIIPHHLEGLTRSVNFYHRYFSSESNKRTRKQCTEIRFYDIDQPFGELSNFSDHPIFIDGEIWRTVEHYYQAHKFTNPLIKQSIRLCHTPVEAKKISSHNQVIHCWGTVKLKIMEVALYAKFTQHSELTTLLMSTEDSELIEDSTEDEFWGCGAENTGENNLGKLLMMIRQQLQAKDRS